MPVASAPPPSRPASLVRLVRLSPAHLALTLLLCVCARAQAVSLVPMEMEFAVQGRNATRVFRIDNPGDEPAAVEVSARTRRVDEDGTEHQDDADDDFAIFPRQIVLRPGQSQAVRVQWLGKAPPATELAYRLIAEQLPLDPPPLRTTGASAAGTAPRSGAMPRADGVQIRVLMRYEAALYVVPPGARGRVVTGAVERVVAPADAAQGPPAAGGGDPGRLRITLENAGTAHVLLHGARLTLTAADGSVHHLAGAQLGELAGANLLANTRRHFIVTAPAGLPAGPLRAAIEGNWLRP